MAMKILITSALPYVNNIPHLGNIIGCVLSADVFARYCRSRGHECIYVCGTDEYGTATEIKAMEENISPQEVCDKYYDIHKDIYEWFDIDFDIFGRTSTDRHREITQEIFLDLHENGYISEEMVEQFYDQEADLFLADRYVEGTCPYCNYEGARSDQCDKCGRLLHHSELKDPVSKVSGTRPVLRKTKHLFIDLPKIEGKLREWIEKASREGFWSENSVNIAKSWLKEGLRKRDITRDLRWGIPVPVDGYRDKVFYVWFEAPIGYISITANLTEKWKEWWMNPDEIKLFQFMGKDNVPFHTVMFPSTLLGTGQPWTMLHHINTTEYLNYESGKFSKSRHVGVFGDDAMKSGIPSDVWRYYLLVNRPEHADTKFTWDDFADKTNNELLANLGNLVNRTLVFIEKYFGGKMPAGEIPEEMKDYVGLQEKKVREITSHLDRVELKDALHEIMAYSKNANKFFQDNKPWELIKSDKEKAGVVLGILTNQVKDLAIMTEPYLPETSSRIFRQLATEPEGWENLGKPLPEGHRIGSPEPLFRKIEEKQLDEFRKKFAGERKDGFRFSDLDLEVGEIISVEKHPDADKLFIEKIRLGDGERQIVSGLAGHYFPENLVGRKVVIVKNLAGAKLRGAESEGMLLAAEGREREPMHDGSAAMEKDMVEVIFPTESRVGDKVFLKGEKPSPKKTVTFKEFETLKIEVLDYYLFADGKSLVTESGEELKMKHIKKGRVT
ncbi:methionine--tRNA ligase [Candidatus Micrarchaeota archaeon]|nr:methionine--tRNA ligase [Candidatus Micrarchaeota archaeon]